MKAGDPGYIELVDFKEEIGLFVDPVSHLRIPTNWGIIVYGREGIHIIPARPPSDEKVSDEELRKRVLAEFRRALLTSLPSHISGLTIGWDRTKIGIFCYHEDEISDDDRELIWDVAADVIAGFTDHQITINYIQGDMPEANKHFNYDTWKNPYKTESDICDGA